VAVISADTFLGIQDFRADEKALQILEQFRGRCGRRERKGTFVIQTSQPEHPVYTMIGMRSSTGSDLGLMQERKDFNFPPYTRIIELTFRDRFEDRAEREASELVKTLGRSFDITGPYSPAVDKVADQHIRMVRISLKKDRNLSLNKRMILEKIHEFEKSRRYDGHISINVDPS
jgi:primosomal protein N' (replication factor Y)